MYSCFIKYQVFYMSGLSVIILRIWQEKIRRSTTTLPVDRKMIMKSYVTEIWIIFFEGKVATMNTNAPGKYECPTAHLTFSEVHVKGKVQDICSILTNSNATNFRHSLSIHHHLFMQTTFVIKHMSTFPKVSEHSSLKVVETAYFYPAGRLEVNQRPEK